MADLASSLIKVNDIESAQNAPVSEATVQKVGSTANGLIDALGSQDARITVLEKLPYTVSSGPIGIAYDAGFTSASFGSYTFTGRPVMIIFNSGTSTGGAGVVMSLRTTSHTLATWTASPYSYSGTIYLLTPTSGTYSFYCTRTGQAYNWVNSVSFTIIQL